MKRSKYGVSLDTGDYRIQQCTTPFAHQTQPAEYRIAGAGESFADAIRDAGIRCETCEHYSVLDKWNGECGEVADPNEMTVFHKFFCAHHSQLSEEEE